MKCYCRCQDWMFCSSSAVSQRRVEFLSLFSDTNIEAMKLLVSPEKPQEAVLQAFYKGFTLIGHLACLSNEWSCDFMLTKNRAHQLSPELSGNWRGTTSSLTHLVFIYCISDWRSVYSDCCTVTLVSLYKLQIYFWTSLAGSSLHKAKIWHFIRWMMQWMTSIGKIFNLNECRSRRKAYIISKLGEIKIFLLRIHLRIPAMKLGYFWLHLWIWCRIDSFCASNR